MGRNQLFPLHNQKMGISTCLSLLGILCFVVEIAVAAVEFQKERCEPRRCGKGTPEIRYPFWITDLQASYCGYPRFGVNCSGEVSVLAISDAKYNITGINYDSKTVMVQQDLIHRTGSNSSCVYPSRNLTTENTDFKISHANGNSSLYFLVNCSNMTQKPPGYFETRCPGKGKPQKLYVGNHTAENMTNLISNCSQFLVSPVVKTPGTDISDYARFFNGSIDLNWVAPDCNDCSKSGGYCGYNDTSNRVVCLCDDRVHQFECQKKKLNVPLKIVIGICSSLGGFFLAFICFYYWYKHKHTKRTSSLTKSLRNSSSKHVSMEYDIHSLSSPCHSTHIFSYNELQVATDGFASYNELGDGGFGTVYKGKLKDGRTVAIKRLYENSYKRVEQFNNEVSILNRLRHQNLVTLYGSTSHQSRELVLVYEYISNGTVADHLHGVRADEGALTWFVRMNIAIETAQALSYLHAVEPPIIHRDVKTNNILLDENFHVKVADFGLSRLFPPDVTHVSTVPQGTPGYVDPEYYQCYKLTDKSDVYSFGVVLVELISSKPAVDINRHRHEINLSTMAINKIQNSLLHELVDLRLGFDLDWKVRKMIESVAEVAFRCLQSEKEMRPTIKEVHEQLERIVNRNYDEEKSDDPDIKTNDDTSLLKDPVQFSPSSVAVPWASRSTTPNTSK